MATSPDSEPSPGGMQNPPGEDAQDAQVDAFMDTALRVIYGGKTKQGELSDTVSQMLREVPEDPVRGLANASVQIASTVVNAAQDQGQQLDGAGVVLPGTWAISNELAEIARTEGIYDYSDEELQQSINASSEMLMDMTAQSGIWNEQEMQGGMDELMAANQDGGLQAIMQDAEQATMQGGSGGGMM